MGQAIGLPGPCRAVITNSVITISSSDFFGFWIIQNFLLSGGKALQPSIYGFTAIYGFIAVTCNLVVTFGDAHWAELIWPQHWAGVRACPP